MGQTLMCEFVGMTTFEAQHSYRSERIDMTFTVVYRYSAWNRYWQRASHCQPMFLDGRRTGSLFGKNLHVFCSTFSNNFRKASACTPLFSPRIEQQNLFCGAGIVQVNLLGHFDSTQQNNAGKMCIVYKCN